jgi:hypothetical protein
MKTLELDLTKMKSQCGSGGTTAFTVLSNLWYSLDDEAEVRVKASRGFQQENVELFAMAFADRGVKILSKVESGDDIEYKIYLPKKMTKQKT